MAEMDEGGLRGCAVLLEEIKMDLSKWKTSAVREE